MGTILISDEEANKSLSRTDKNTKTLGERLGSGIKTAAKWGTALVGAAVGVGVAMFGMVNKATQAADAIAKGAEKVGMSTDFYQEMSYWAGQNGLSHENMEKTLGRFNQRVGMAIDGNSKYADALKNLGVNLDDVRDGTLSTEDAYAQSISTLSEMENEHEKVALATELFGTKLARELLPALNDGSLSIDEARQKAQELGLVLEEDSLNAAEQFQDSWDDIKSSLGTAVTQIGLDLMPMFQTMMDWVISNIPAIREYFSNAFNVIGDVISAVVGFIQENLIPRLQDLWDWIAPNLPMIQQIFEDVFGKGKEVLEGLVEAIKDATRWFQDHWNIIGPIMVGIAAAIGTFKLITGAIAAYGAITKAITAIQLLFNTALTLNPIGIVVVAIGALVAAGVMLWKNWDVVKAKLDQFWNKIKNVFSNIKTKVSDTFNNLKDDAINWGKNMIGGFIDGIKSMAGKVANAAKGVVSGIGDFLKFWSPAKKGEGRYIVHWGRNMVDGFLDGVIDGKVNVGGVMDSVVSEMKPSNFATSNGVHAPIPESTTLESALPILTSINEGIKQLQSMSMQVDGKAFAKLTGDYTDAEGGTRVRRLERGLAT